MRVILGIYAWSLTGVNCFAKNLARGLLARGVDASLLITEHATDLVQLPADMMPLPADIPHEELPIRRNDDWTGHWRSTIRYLEERSPCVYLPISDYRHSCISPKLSEKVVVVGTIQSDDPVHFEHVSRLGAFWNGIVCVSNLCAAETVRRNPWLTDRVFTIPNGVVVPGSLPIREYGTGPLRIIYHGVLNHHQKRILDVPRILEQLDSDQVPFQMTIAGAGPEQAELLAQCERWINRGSVRYVGLIANDDVGQLLVNHDAYLLPSAFEGMPHAMLEAMAHGCVPVVTDIASGARDVIQDGVNGLLTPVGDCRKFAELLGRLQADPELRQRLAAQAHQALRNSPYNVDSMVEQYSALFQRLSDQTQRGEFRRPRQKVLPPPANVDGISIFPVDHAVYVERLEQELLEPVVEESGLFRRWSRRFAKLLRERV